MLRKVLVVDDSKINRQMLHKILGEAYEVIEADDGEAALALLRQSYPDISAVLLDLHMPELDGFGVLSQMQDDERFGQIPVIVATGSTYEDAENRALSLGAADFVNKPYHASTLRRRLFNAISLRETDAVVRSAKLDDLTGLYNRQAFFELVAERIAAKEPGYYVMGTFDVDKFKVINDQYGSETGDAVLKGIASIFLEGFAPVDGLCCRITADNFAVLYPRSFMDSDALVEIRRRASVLDGSIQPITFSVGRYIIDDLSIPVSGMYDRAVLAQSSVKGRFDVNIALYDESMRARLLREQKITSEMKHALESEPFEVWFQPQFNHSTGALIGAEALVRWRHPENGLLVAPGEFVPVFERNGFIYEMDKYIWERTCRLLRKWLDEGLSPLPLSVNISRYDVFRSDFIDVITGLVAKYRIPTGLLRLEITETAFAKSTAQIVAVVRRLIDRGFTIEIDDFGSGYSSLNTLKDVPAQVLKLDMRFLEDDGHSKRGGNILESIVRMSKWLNMSVIAEGVETRQQADYLKSIGCNYVQGYLYARPMPSDEYEAMVHTAHREEQLLQMETVENLDSNLFWDPQSMDTLIFNTYVGGACIFEWHNGRIEILRANEKYGKIIGGEHVTIADVLELVWEDHMDEAAAAATYEAICRAIETGDDATYEAAYFNLFGSSDKTYLRTTFRVIARSANRYLLYATNENLTAQRRAEERTRAINEQMQAILSNVSGGITAVVVRGEDVEYLFVNDRYYEMFGFTREQYHAEVHNAFDLIHPEDRQRVFEAVERINATGVPAVLEYRVIRRDGRMIWERNSISVVRFDGIDAPVQLGVAMDITEERRAAEKIRASAEQLHLLNDTASDLLGGPDVSAGIQSVLQKVLDYFGAARAHIYEYNFEKQLCISIHDVYSPTTAPYATQRLEVPLSEAWYWIKTFEESDFFRFDASEALDESRRGESEMYRDFSIHSVLSVALRAGGKLIGSMGVDNPTRHLEAYHNLKAIGDYMAAILTRRDLTARIERDREALLNMMNDTPGGFARLRVMPDGALSTVYVNQNFCRLRGTTAEHILAADIDAAMEIIHPDDRQLVDEAVTRMLRTGETCNIRYRMQHIGGEYIPVNVFGRVSVDETGESYINAYFVDLTQQEKKDLTLRETMPYVLSAIMEDSTDLMFAKDKEFRYICCSPAFVKFTRQKSEADVIGRTDYDFWTKEEADHFRGDDMRLYEGGEPLLDYIEPIPSDDGIQHYCRTSKYILRDSTGEVIGMYGIGRDITQARATAEQLRLLTDNIPGGLATYALTRDGLKLIYFNDGLCRMMGCTREEYEAATRDGVIAAVFEEDLPMLRAHIDNMIATGTPVNCTYRIRNMNGEGYKWVNLRTSPAEKQGESLTTNAVLFDVTEQKLAEEAARIHEEEMQLAISKLGKMICEYDPVTRTLTVPESFAAKYGVPATVTGVPDCLIESGIIHEETVSSYRAFFDAILRGEKTGATEYCDRRADGSYHWQHVEFSTIFDSDGKPVKAILAVENTTEQHLKYELERSRPTLGEENLLVHALFNLNTGETLEYASYDGSEVPLAQRTAFLFGSDNLETIIINDEERAQYRRLNDPAYLLACFERGETELSIDYRRRMPDGEILWVRNLLHLVREPGGSDILLFEYCYNIETEKLKELMYGTLINENYDYVARINGTSGRFTVMVNINVQDTFIPQSGEDFDTVATAVVNARAHPDDRDMMLKHVCIAGIKRNLEAEGRFQITFRVIRPDGEIGYKRITQSYLDRERDILIFTREDVTALMQEEIRKNALLEAALAAANEESRVKEREAAAQLTAIINNVNGGMSAATLIDRKIGYLYVNDEYYAMFGYTKAQFESELPNGLVDIIHPDDLEMVYRIAEDSVAVGTARMEFRVYRRDGSLIWVRAISSACTITGIDAPVHIAVLIDITKEKEAADSLRMSEEQFRIAASIGSRAIVRYDIKTHCYHHHDEALLSMGYGNAVEDVPETFVDAGLIAPESVSDYLDLYASIQNGASSCSADCKIRFTGDEFRWCRMDATVVFDADGKPSQAIIVLRDITELREKEAVYKKWQQSLQQRTPENYTLLRCNLSKNASFDSMEGSLLTIVFSPSSATFDDRTREYADQSVFLEDRDAYIAFLYSDTLLANYYRGTRMKTLEYRQVLPDNRLRWLRLTIELVEYPNSKDIEAYLMYEDIDESKRDELRNKELAETDPLTGILNRNAFASAVERMITEAGASKGLALLMLDIDGFKLINDTFGHAMGDQVLIEIADSLRSVLRQGDLLGRLGGDEFLICLRDMSDDAAIERKAGQICRLLHRALSLEVYTSASIGIAVYPRDGKDFETLYRKMDTALYVVKDHGKNSYAFYRDSMKIEYAKLGIEEDSNKLASLAAQKRNKRMLIVEDHQISRSMLAKVFQEEYTIEMAQNGEEALECLRRFGTRISIVLLDLIMPGMSGFAVLETMRNSAELQTIPVIVVSGLDEQEACLRSLKCGAADFVTKPVNPELIRLRVQSVISRAENAKLRAQNSMLFMHNTEIAKYRAAMESAGAAVIEFEPASGTFFYDPSVSNAIAGNFDDRPLWDILCLESAASAEDVANMQALVQSTAEGGVPCCDRTTATLLTRAGEPHRFCLHVQKRANAAGFPERLILTFIDMDAGLLSR